MIPNTPHWAIIREESTHIPGDLRSQQAPGHGYPAHTVTNSVYEPYTDEAKWRSELERRVLRGDNVVGIKAIPYTATKKVDVQITDGSSGDGYGSHQR